MERKKETAEGSIGLHKDNVRGYIGRMEKKMETTIVFAQDQPQQQLKKTEPKSEGQMLRACEARLRAYGLPLVSRV